MANNKDCGFRTSIGGQALIEGILMRGPKKQAIVCRTAEGLVEKVDELKLLKDKYPIFGWPFIRGCVTFIDSMIKGMQALTYSAELVPVEDQEPDKLDQWIEKHFEAEKASKIVIGTAVVLGIALALFLFIFLPTLIVGLIKPLTQNLVIRNLSEGVVKIIILLAYMRLCCCVSDVKRLFSYHGAEHKTIACYEAGEELTVENIRRQSRFHPRCGTSFMILVIIISIFLYAVLPWTSTAMRVVYKLCMFPLLVGISYEILKWAGRSDSAAARIISQPGLWMQRLTTFEPDDSMIEVAIAAVTPVLPEKQEDARW